MLTIIGSIVLGFMVSVFMLAAHYLFNAEAENTVTNRFGRVPIGKRLSEVDVAGWKRAIGTGIMVCIINIAIYKLPANLAGFAFIGLLLMVIAYMQLAKWWGAEGASVKEMIVFIILAILFFFTTLAAAEMGASVIENGFFKSVIVTIPGITFILTVGYIVINFFYFRYFEVKESRGKKLAHHIGGIVAIALTTLCLICTVVNGLNWRAIHSTRVEAAETETVVPETAPAPANEEWYTFFNAELQEDEDPENDFNFGTNPFLEGKDASYYDESFRDRLKLDPALAAADMAWADAILGTRFMGEFYDSCNEDWALAINTAKVRFTENQENYYASLRAFFSLLDHAEVRIEHRDTGLDDQMYMNPFTIDNVPDVIVMETDDHGGWFLVYTITVKGQTFDVAYRIDCGYQPTDVEEIMHITPTPSPTPTPDPTPAPTPQPTPDPTPTPTPTPQPEPETEPETEPSTRPPKDPTQGTQGDVVAPNDDTGPGPDTNSGVGSTTSSVDRPDTSTSYSSYDEYETAMEELETINATQRQGGDSNVPSTPAPSTNTNVDNNAVSGNGGAGVDTPTATQPLATDAATGETISDSPAGAWGGPPD